MLRITIKPHWQIGREREAALDANALLELLSGINETGGIAQAARGIGLSYRHAWGLIKRAEALFGHALLEAGRGRGSSLTEFARKLVWADARIAARLQPLLESLASELEGELDRSLAHPHPVLRLHASHGFAVAALLEQLEARRLALELRYRNSFEAVAALSRGECDLAGFHVPIGEFEAAAAERYLRWLRPGEHSLIQLAVRMQGLFVAAGNPKAITSLADLARPDVRFVNRPAGSGTRMLTEMLFQRQGIAASQVAGYDNTELTHAAVAAYVASGMADAGIGVQTAAHRFGLNFIPLLRERYYFALPTQALSRAEMRPLLQVLQSSSYRAKVAALVGYEAGETGKVVGVEEALVR